MADIFAEVDEIMHQERLQKLWSKHGPKIIIAITAIILVTAAVSTYKWWNERTQIRQTNQVFALLESTDFPASLQEQNLKLRPSLETILYLTGADAALKQNKEELAFALYTKAAQAKGPAELRDLAILMQARLMIRQGNEKDVLPVLGQIGKKSPWKPYADLEAAAIMGSYHDELSHKIVLKSLQNILDTKNVPTSLHEKAQALKSVYTAEAENLIKKPENNTKDQTP